MAKRRPSQNSQQSMASAILPFGYNVKVKPAHSALEVSR
jgi:hypothetical protein